MANYQTLKAAINAVIKANGNKEITGTVLNEVLLAMVNSLGAGYQFAGVATPSTNPGTPDQKVFYIASQAGTYNNFGGAVVSDGIAIFKWNGTWATEMLDLSMAGQVQSDWTETDTTKKSYIKHKPNIPPSANVDPVPTNGSPNAVASGGVYNALKTITDFLNNGYYFVGIAGKSTVPDAVTQYGIFYIASDGGTYTNFLNGDDEPLTLYQGLNIMYKDIEDDGWNYFEVFKFSDFVDTTQQQSLSTQQKAQARTNIAAVSYDAQTLNADQQVQAQNNIAGKSYNAAAFSGLGKKVLAKNVIEVSGVNKNVMTQAFFNATNTVYVIQYDYTLGENITIPAGCTLQFDGGSISGDGSDKNTITCDLTKIISTPTVIFKKLTLSGSVVGDIVLNHFLHTEDCVTSSKNLNTAIYVNGYVEIDAPIVLSAYSRIYGNASSGSELSLSSNYNGAVKAIIIFDSTALVNNIIIEDLVFSHADYAMYRNSNSALMASRFRNIKIQPTISVSAISVTSGYGCNTISKMTCMDANMSGAMISINSTWANQNAIEGCYFSGSAKCVFEMTATTQCDNNYFRNCWLEQLYMDGDAINVSTVGSAINVKVFEISSNWFESFFDRTQGTEVKKGVANFNVSSDNMATVVLFDRNNFSANLQYALNANSKYINANFENNQMASVGSGYLLGKLIEGGSDSRSTFFLNNNNQIELTNSDVNLNKVYSQRDIITKAASFIDYLYHIHFVYLELANGASETRTLLPDNYPGNSIYWSDIQISGSNGKITVGKMLWDSGVYTFKTVFTDDDGLIIQQADNNGRITLTNNSGSMVVYRIGIILMKY